MGQALMREGPELVEGQNDKNINKKMQTSGVCIFFVDEKDEEYYKDNSVF